ncbi:MAG TPA: nickel pincer cofactor biosynthesis protein LarB [Nitrolancea sp.]|nr:nickel pincer cofactor biosynthesis protein LarB [Nitrolancea sp.]
MNGKRGRPSDGVLSDLIASLTSEDTDGTELGASRNDAGRVERKGIPEVIYASNKSQEQIIEITRVMLSQAGRAIISRAPDGLVEHLRSTFPTAEIDHRPGMWTVAVRGPGCCPAPTGGRVAIFAAGTSDLPVVDEARVIAEQMGCAVQVIADVGVAGLHRLFGPLRKLLDEGVDAIIVAAGMDGALPSVVAGLVPVPVIGLPTSIGYGYGGGGQAALMSMLQTCTPGLTVVNIDNGIGAGASAAMIANAIARARLRD